jgi:hypothetical protein
LTHSFPACDAHGIGGARCHLMLGHPGLHAAELRWGPAADDDDAPTVTLPPIRDTVGVRRRPPVPEVRDLADRAELLEAMGRELGRELRELLAADPEDEGR